MIKYMTNITKDEILHHPELRNDILVHFDKMIDKIEDGKNADSCFAGYVRYLDNYVRNKPTTVNIKN